ncbi:YggU family protein [Candidatus Woesearchaeota archaeon]|nr:YggU family protein [Candidatus Woesearchaeota archaeon]
MRKMRSHVAREISLNEYVKNGQLHVIIKAGAAKTEILGYDHEREAVHISIAAPAKDNKANLALVKFVAKHTKKKVRILRGHRSREKILELT